MKHLNEFACLLQEEEKSKATVEKYTRDAKSFLDFAGEKVGKMTVIGFKEDLIRRNYAPRSINSILAGVNSYLKHCGRENCCVKGLKLQNEPFCDENNELSMQEYLRLLDAAGSRSRLGLILQTLGSTGIRISELTFFTVDAVRQGKIGIENKGKDRVILLPESLCEKLLAYAGEKEYGDGLIFRTRSGRPMDRSNIWTEMKGLCGKTGIPPQKVHPHNFRKLFARSFYQQEKDLAELADVLGHSSINTTRIYIRTSGKEHREKIERMGMVR